MCVRYTQFLHLSRRPLKDERRKQPASDDSRRKESAPPPRPIPPSIELAWGLRDQGARGPKRGLTLERIVEAGIAIAGEEGLDALSMSRVARELGVGTMSLYRYVAAKGELLTLMVDSALGLPPRAREGEDWRAGLARWAVGVRDAYRRHPWALKIPIDAPPLGPNNVAWLDDALRALADTPLSEQQKLSSVLLVSGFVRNDATLTADFAAAAGGELVMPGYGTLLAKLTDEADFPALHRAIASGALDDEDDIDHEFNFGLERVLDGIEVSDRARARARHGPRAPRELRAARDEDMSEQGKLRIEQREGSVDLYLGPEQPARAPKANWIKTEPGEGFVISCASTGQRCRSTTKAGPQGRHRPHQPKKRTDPAKLTDSPPRDFPIHKD